MEINNVSSAGVGMGNGWMSPLDQGKYASYLFFHGLLDKAQYEQLDEIGEVYYKSANCDLTPLLASNIKSESVKRHVDMILFSNRRPNLEYDCTAKVAGGVAREFSTLQILC